MSPWATELQGNSRAAPLRPLLPSAPRSLIFLSAPVGGAAFI